MPYFNVIIEVKNRQRDASGEEQQIKVTTEGRFFYGPTMSKLVYKEAEVTGLGHTTTVLTIPHDKVEVTLERSGENESRMQFCEGDQYQTQMQTPYGSMQMGFYTQQLRLDLDQEQGRGQIDIDYSLDFNHQKPLNNHIEISFFKPGERRA